ncbi:MAG: lipid-A-disaccharide synthase [Proteobacteria bacterium]|nr:lipid-A-disaccharide synthase [Pseudomonadota bacterium]
MPETKLSGKFNKEIVIITGELSGEIHAFHLIDELKYFFNFQFSGIGSTKLRDAGVDIVYDYKNISLTGLSEIFSKLRHIRDAFSKIKKHLREKRPSLLILVDFPGFNMRIARFAHNLGIPVIYFIPPQIWAWRKKRIYKIKKYVNKVICILPFEKKIYEDYSIDVAYAGHPYMEIVKPLYTREDFLRMAGIGGKAPVLTIMPGSRDNEVEKHMPILMDIIEAIEKRVENLKILLPLAENIDQKIIEKYRKENIEITYLKGLSYDALANSDLAIIASGSATLEAAILGTPTIVIYKISFLSYVFARLLVKINYISLPNIIAGKEVFPEFIQTFDVEKIAEKALYMLSNGKEKIKVEIDNMKIKLGKENSYKMAAKTIVEFMEHTYGALP